MSSNRSIIPICAGLALLIGWAVAPLDRSIAERLGQNTEVETLRNLDSQFGQGLSVAILGGYRSVAANLVWLSMNQNWEQRDLAGTFGKLVFVTSIDPRPELFWLNGSRIIANDMPTWVIGIDNTDLHIESAEVRAISSQYANRALGFLEGSRVYHEQNPLIYIEEAMILWRKANDLEGAMGRFEQAIRAESPPFYAYRMYGELLVKLDRKEKALKLLETHYETLPEESIEAMKPVVADRIRNLRRELGH